MKALLILSDGMRPDSIDGLPYIEKLKKLGSFSMNARTVMPSVTLPCHMSLFHSVPPERHGITTNTYIPPVRPINGICEQVKIGKKRSALFYNWEEIRDLARPGRICRGEFFGGRMYGYDRANEYLCEKTAEYLASEDAADFTFLYLGWTDSAGHKFGWMSDGYLDAMKRTVDMIEKLTDSLSDEFVTIITSDHGGHGRDHGSDCDEDMTIPIFAFGGPFEGGRVLENASILDIAPTVAELLSVDPDPDWEGKSFI